MVGHGEGENAVRLAAEAVRTSGRPDNIPGTWYRDPEGVVHKNPKDALVNLNDTRPDFELFDDSRFMRPMGGRVFKMIPVETYRGCPFACTYCNSPAQRAYSKDEGLGNFLRRKTMDVLHAELAHYMKEFEPNFFYFVDDSFLARPREEIFAFCDMYEEFDCHSGSIRAPSPANRM